MYKHEIESALNARLSLPADTNPAYQAFKMPYPKSPHIMSIWQEFAEDKITKDKIFPFLLTIQKGMHREYSELELNPEIPPEYLSLLRDSLYMLGQVKVGQVRTKAEPWWKLTAREFFLRELAGAVYVLRNDIPGALVDHQIEEDNLLMIAQVSKAALEIL